LICSASSGGEYSPPKTVGRPISTSSAPGTYLHFAHARFAPTRPRHHLSRQAPDKPTTSPKQARTCDSRLVKQSWSWLRGHFVIVCKANTWKACSQALGFPFAPRACANCCSVRREAT